MKQRLRVLVSAYACEPDRGSEPGTGWNWVRQIARYNDAWVITRVNNRRVIEAALAKDPLPNAHFIYFDLPRWARFWKRRRRGLHLYYYLWQIGAYVLGKRLHRQVRFDLVHHVTFAMYWIPSFLSLLPAPLLWGPVGGGETAPASFRRALGLRGRLFEILRNVAQAVGHLDPFVRTTARRAALALATTDQTVERLKRLGSRRVQVCSAMGMPSDEIESLGRLERAKDGVFRLLSVGELLHLKGFDMGIRAFAKLKGVLPNAEYWLIGAGPERQRLEDLARELGVAQKVRFWGALPRPQVLERLGQCDVLVHPVLHDSGGCVCTEAMAAGRPVVCLDLGGPALQVTPETGFKITPLCPEQAVRDLAEVIHLLAEEPALRARMGEAARRRVRESFAWDTKGDQLRDIYASILRPAATVSNQRASAELVV